jgi:hypothetical protein
VRQCVEVGLVRGKHLLVDGSWVEANAAKESRIPRDRLPVSPDPRKLPSDLQVMVIPTETYVGPLAI